MKSLLLQRVVRLLECSFGSHSAHLVPPFPKAALFPGLSDTSQSTFISKLSSSTHSPVSYHATVKKEPSNNRTGTVSRFGYSHIDDAGSDVSGSMVSSCVTLPALPETIPELKEPVRTQGYVMRLEDLEKREHKLERTIDSLFRRFCYEQAVVIGKLPTFSPDGQIFVISQDQDVPPYCSRVQCRLRPDEWPTALALMGFDWRESTAWLLRLQGASDSTLLQQLKAVAMMSAPCSVVLLLSWSPMAVEVADDAGFSMDVVQYGAPLYLLRRKERHARCDETESPYTSPPYSPPPEPAFDGWLVRFGLVENEMPHEVRDKMMGGCVKVVGNSKALGGWNVGRGVRLKSIEGILSADILIEQEKGLEYKYVVQGQDGTVLWERGWNRCLSGVDEICICLEEHWRV